MPNFIISLPIVGRTTREVFAKTREEARIKAKRLWEELPLDPDEYYTIDYLQIGDIDGFEIKEADEQ